MTRRVLVVAVAAFGFSGLLVGNNSIAATPTSTLIAAPGASSIGGVYQPGEPCRLLDTRVENPGRLSAGSTIVIGVADRCGVGAEVSSVALSVTVVAASGPGFLTLWGEGAKPESSNLNYESGDVRANSAIVSVDDDGSINVFSLAATHLVIDVMGRFEPVQHPVAVGRYVPLMPHRLIDTRDSARPLARAVVRVDAGVPDDALAVSVNLTTTNTTGPDFFTAYQAGTHRPVTSNLNIDAVRQTRSVGVIVPVAAGAFDVFTLTGNHVIADITGYFTGPSADVSSDGLYVSDTPRRLVDTRLPVGQGGPRIFEGGAREFDVTAVVGGPVAAVAANWTVTNSEDLGYWLAYPAGVQFGASSTVNVDDRTDTVANALIVPVSDRGVAVFASESADVVVDITGWFTGTPVATTGPVAQNVPLRRKVSIVGDSAMAGLRWNEALGGLAGFDVDQRLESCRRLVHVSCRGREGYKPDSALVEIWTLPPAGPNDLLVIATGYNDWESRFSADFDWIIHAARSRGFRHIAWVTYRANNSYFLPGESGPARSDYGAMNAVLFGKVATGAFDDVYLWDLNTYALGAPQWFKPDGVHQTTVGSWAVADWISRHVAAFDGRPCPTPWQVGGQPANACPNPDHRPYIEGLPGIEALYGVW